MRTYANTVTNKFVTETNGTAGAGALVTVYTAGSTVKAPLFDVLSAAITNPLAADDEGNYSFKVADGIYDIVINEGALSETKIERLQIAEIIGLNDDNGHFLDIVSAQAANIDVGTVITTAGFLATNDGGGGQYVVVPGGTGPVGGGLFIDMLNGNQLELIVIPLKYPVENVTALRLIEPRVDGQEVNLLGHTYDGVGGGVLYFDKDDTTTADNNITVFVTTSGNRWKRQDVRAIQVEWGGLDTTGATDDTVLMQAVVDLELPMTIGEGSYQFANIIQSLTSKTFVLKGVSSTSGFVQITAPAGYSGYILEVQRNYDISGIKFNGHYQDGQFGIGADAAGSGGGRVALYDLDLREFDQAIRFGTEFEHPIGLQYSNIYIQTYRTAAINLGGTSGPASSGESCWSFDNVMTPNTSAAPVVYSHTVQVNTPSATNDTVNWSGDSPEFGYLVLRSLNGSTDWHIPPNWTSDNFSGTSFVSDKELGETWVYIVLRMTVGCNLRRGKIVNIGVMQNEYTGIGLRLDDIKGCNVGAHYYEIRNTTTAQGGYAAITTKSSEVVIQTCRSEESGYGVFVGSNSKVHVERAISNGGIFAVFGNGGATQQLLTFGNVSQGTTPEIYHAPLSGAADFNYASIQYGTTELVRTISHETKAADEYLFRGEKKGSVFANNDGCTAEITRLELKLNSKNMTPVVENNIGDTILTEGVDTDFLTLAIIGDNQSASVRFHYKVVVFDGLSVARQTESGWLDIDTMNIATTTPTSLIGVSNVRKIGVGTLTLVFNATGSAGSLTASCTATSTVTSANIQMELHPITQIGNVEGIVQL